MNSFNAAVVRRYLPASTHIAEAQIETTVFDHILSEEAFPIAEGCLSMGGNVDGYMCPIQRSDTVEEV
ncbi:hypothetical protein PsorP6_013029 [Peronosclerospora sorghi]|uniref:Uncharacterized protein n=1 Tax=Peronosclerospora sorghi TaxID=230839 RepID=A0ACC0WFR0_9STRA|nr:hypothetical protein PsorP6_013029 [Peronosclerospora sorghi]